MNGPPSSPCCLKKGLNTSLASHQETENLHLRKGTAKKGEREKKNVDFGVESVEAKDKRPFLFSESGAAQTLGVLLALCYGLLHGSVAMEKMMEGGRPGRMWADSV
mgnify:CR=1 FL=1